MSRNRREHGRIISVETHTRGDALAEDAAAGATSITVEDAGDFDEDGGWLTIGGQVIEFSECDDDTGVILLVDPLTAAAEQGDPVQVWSDLYGEVIEFQQALVELDGEYDNPDPVVAEVAEGVGDLPEGDRGRAGESCTLHRVGDDEWEVIAVGGRSRKSRAVRWEQDDTYTLTAGDITAGTVTMPLSHRPCDEALTCVLAGVPQSPAEWTISYDAQTLTMPLDGWEQAGDVLWVHYAYRKGITTARAVNSLVLRDSSGAQDTAKSSLALPAGTQVGDLIVVAASWAVGALTVSDARLTQYFLDTEFFGGGDPVNRAIWIGTASTLAALNISAPGGFGKYYEIEAATFESATVSPSYDTTFGAGNPATIPSTAASNGLLVVMCNFVTTDGNVPAALAGYSEAANDDFTGKRSVGIFYWNNSNPSPGGSMAFTSGIDRWRVVSMGVS